MPVAHGVVQRFDSATPADALVSHNGPVTVEKLATTFSRAKREDVQELLETLVAVGQARQVDDLRYAA